jgi:hypothetical protein
MDVIETQIYPIEFLAGWKTFLDLEVGLDYEITYLDNPEEPFGDIGFNITIFDATTKEFRIIQNFEEKLIKRLKYILTDTLELRGEENE